MVKISSFKAQSLVSTLERSWRSQIFGLAISFEEFLESIGEIYCPGRRTAKTQAVCLELGPLCTILEFPSPPSFSPDPPDSLGTLLRARFRRTWHFLWLWRCSAPPPKPEKSAPGTRLYIFHQTAHFFWLEICRKPIFCPKIAQKCKTCSRLPELQKILLSTPEVF